MTNLQKLQLVAQATELALLSGPDRDRVRQAIQELAELLKPLDENKAKG